jgi:DNA (cytosine-5)-methyltransferase 1
MEARTHRSTKKSRPVGIDLFAGAGGLSLGFEQAGFDIAAAVEIDPIHCGVHEYNFPNSKSICASVVDLTGDAIRALAGLGEQDIDVVFGGAPCQGFSMMGKRALDDPRNQLVFHFVRLVEELKPKYFVFENVKGLTVGKHKQFLNEIITALETCGYDVLTDYRVLNAADHGVPQDRQRLFLIGARRDQCLPNYPAHGERVTVSEAISDLPNADDFEQLATSDSIRLSFTTTARYAQRLRGIAVDANDFSYPRRFDFDLLTSSLRTAHSALSQQRFMLTAPGETEKISRFRKLPLDGVCNTLRAGTDSARGAFTSPRPIHPAFPRVITVREAARLHSYPDWFRFHITKWHGFRQIGNSVPPLLGRAVAAEIMKSLQIKPQKPKTMLSLGDEKLLSFNMTDAARHYRVSSTVIAQRVRKTPFTTIFDCEVLGA